MLRYKVLSAEAYLAKQGTNDFVAVLLPVPSSSSTYRTTSQSSAPALPIRKYSQVSHTRSLHRAARMDKESRLKILRAMVRMDVLAAFICVGIIAIVFLALMTRPAPSKREVELRTARWFPYLVVFFCSCLAMALPLSKVLIYFGIPRTLTFGYQIGKVAPTTCAESMEVEGPDGLPCSLERFGEWLRRATDGDGNWHLDEFEQLWKDKLVGVLGFALVLVVLFFFFRWGSRRDMEKMEREDAEAALAKSEDEGV